jgi:malonate decarboxylase gamma subunit
VVPDPANRFPRVRHGEVGLDEAWALARHVRNVMSTAPTGGDEGPAGRPRPIVAIVDVSSQAYGRLEETFGIHLACAAAADAYACARWAGHPVIALLVGKAMSGAFLAHGYQANRILALDSSHVQIHAMGKQSAARVTRRSVEELEHLGERIPPMSYTVRAFASLGLLHELIKGVSSEEPTKEQTERVQQALIEAIADARKGPRDLSNRLIGQAAQQTRAGSIETRRRLVEQWDSL